jgi:hypothetical protein
MCKGEFTQKRDISSQNGFHETALRLPSASLLNKRRCGTVTISFPVACQLEDARNNLIPDEQSAIVVEQRARMLSILILLHDASPVHPVRPPKDPSFARSPDPTSPRAQSPKSTLNGS